MKKISRHFTTTTGILTCLAAILIAASAPAATVSFSDTHTIGSTYADFSLAKFDSGLGALTGVQIKVDFSTLAGSMTVTNGEVVTVTVGQFKSYFDLAENLTLGVAEYNPSKTVTTSPAWQTTVIAAGGTQTFTVSAQNLATNYTENILSDYFSAYQSAGGLGTVVLSANDSQIITTTGSIYSVNSSALGASTKMTVTYTYTAVPEPGTIGLLAVAGGVILLAVRRRRA